MENEWLVIIINVYSKNTNGCKASLTVPDAPTQPNAINANVGQTIHWQDRRWAQVENSKAEDAMCQKSASPW